MSSNQGSNWKRKLRWIGSISLLVAIVAVAVWYHDNTQQEILGLSYQLRDLENKQLDEEQKLLLRKDSAWLTMVAQPLAWVIRRELLEDNLSQIHQYLAQYVKHENIPLMMVVNAENKIISATDKVIEGDTAHQLIPVTVQKSNQIIIARSDSTLHVHVPLMGFDKKIGSLFFKYDALTNDDPKP